MSDLQLSLLAIGAVVIAAIYAFNWLQERKYRRIAEAHFKSRHNDVLIDENVAETNSGLHIETIVQMEEPWRVEPRLEPEILTEVSLSEPRVRTASVEAKVEPVMAAEPEIEVEAEPEALSEPEPEAEPLPLHEPAPWHEPEPVPTPEPVQIHVAPEPVYVPPLHKEEIKSTPVDDAICYVATLHAGETIITEDLVMLMQQFSMLGKRVYWAGLRHNIGVWEEINASHPAEYEKIQIGLQLADRNGHITEDKLERFCDIVQQIAADLKAIMDCPDKPAALQQAIELDSFCAEVDVLIGLNVLSHNGETLPATKIRALAEAAGMKLQADGTFHYINDDGVSHYSLANHDSIPFAAESIKHMTTHGVTLLYDVPRAPGGVRTFEQMVALSKQIANAVNGVLVDDNRNALNEKSIATIKQQLATIYTKMDARHIRAGSPRALNLFS